MFQIGDRVVYPMHGAGFVEGIMQQTIAGQQKEYYDIRIHGGGIRLKLPVSGVGSERLRKIIGREEARRLLLHFNAFEIDRNAPWGKRCKENVERLKTGMPEEIAEVVKTLMMRDRTVGLSTGDRQVMITARNALCSELSLALEQSVSEILETLQEAVDEKIG